MSKRQFFRSEPALSEAEGRDLDLGNTPLSLDPVLAGVGGCLDLQVLLQRREEQLDRPSESVELGDHGSTQERFQSSYIAATQKRLSPSGLAREPLWTESLAVGSREFVKTIQSLYRWRKEFVLEKGTDQMGDALWTVREAPSDYGGIRTTK